MILKLSVFLLVGWWKIGGFPSSNGRTKKGKWKWKKKKCNIKIIIRSSHPFPSAQWFFPESTYLGHLLILVGKAFLFPGVYGNPVPGSWGVQAAKGTGRGGEVNGKETTAPWAGSPQTGRAWRTDGPGGSSRRYLQNTKPSLHILLGSPTSETIPLLARSTSEAWNSCNFGYKCSL